MCCYCCCSVTQVCPTLCNWCNEYELRQLWEIVRDREAWCATLMMPSSHLILWHPLPLPPLIFPSIRDFSAFLQTIRVVCSHQMTKILEFQLQHHFHEYSEMISFKIDFFDLLVVQETFRSLPQHHSLKASILWHSAFFTVQVSQS